MIRIIIFSLSVFFTLIFIAACDQSDTRFFEDPDNNGLSLFSNKTNNIASAYFNGEVWRTRDRVYDLISYPSYELYIRKEITATASDTLIFEWPGYYLNQNDERQIYLYFAMAIPKNFRAADLVSLKGRRLYADGITSYFKVRGSSLLPTNKGIGTIYFHMTEIQLNPQADGNGKIAGLFEASIGNLKITKGRFDHNLDPSHVSLP